MKAKLPTYVPVAPQLPTQMPAPSAGRALVWSSATEINKASGPDVSLNLPGYDQVVPVIYGEDRVTGLWLVRPTLDSPNLVFAILWGWGEIEGVQAVYINGEAVPSGVTMTHYVGTSTQGIDPTLDAAVAGFGDTYPNWAYTVFEVPPSTIDGFPQTEPLIEAVVRGRKVYDPRGGTTSWSKNPALCLADFIQSGDYGPGLTVYGVEACADRCDELLGGLPRCEIGITLRQQNTAPEMIGLLAAYAECLWSYHEDGVLLVPDAPVESPVAVLSQSDIVEGTFRIQGQGRSRSPTSVTVTIKEPSGGAALWQDVPVTQKLAGVDTGDLEEIRSDVYMPGIHRVAEGNRKALLRLRRLSKPTSYSWSMFDEGVRFLRGDVIQLPDIRGLSSQLARVTMRELIGRGVYRVAAEPYSADMYPDDFNPGTTSVPEHGIVPFDGSEVPDGWALYTAADGYFLRGASANIGETSGANSFTASGRTSLAGAHRGSSSEGGLPGWIRSEPGSTGTGAFANDMVEEPDHDHAYSTAEIPHQPQYLQMPLIQKTGGAGELPTGAWLLADGAIISPTLAEVSSYLGRLLKAGSKATGGNASPRLVAPAYEVIEDHDHRSGPRAIEETLTFYPSFSKIPAGSHGHFGSISVTFNHKRATLAAFLATSSSTIVPGAIIMFPEGEPLPAGWYETDGNNGTINLDGACIQLSSSTSAGEVLGDDTISWTGVTNTNSGHSHKGEFQGNRTARNGYHPDVAGAHFHNVTGSASYKPLGMNLRFIQYTGVI